MGKVYTRFQTKTTQKPSPLGAAGAYITSTAFPPLPGVHSSVKFCHHVLPWYLTHRLSLGHLIFVVQKMNQNIVFFFFYGLVYSWKPPASVKTLTLTKKEHDIRIPELLVHRYFDFGFTCKETSRGTEISAC